MAVEVERSAWWYRNRGLLFFLIYFIAFALGRVQPLVDTPIAALAIGAPGGEIGQYAALIGATLFAFGGVALRIWGGAYLSSDVVWAQNAQRHQLLVAGPFRYVRNPLYLGNILFAFGIGTLAPLPGWVFVTLANVALCLALADYEKRGLKARYGTAYDEYEQLVPAFIPRAAPAPINSAPAHIDWRAALLGEGFMLAFAFGMVFVTLFGQRGVLGFPICLTLAAIARFIALRQR